MRTKNNQYISLLSQSLKIFFSLKYKSMPGGMQAKNERWTLNNSARCRGDEVSASLAPPTSCGYKTIPTHYKHTKNPYFPQNLDKLV